MPCASSRKVPRKTVDVPLVENLNHRRQLETRARTCCLKRAQLPREVSSGCVKRLGAAIPPVQEVAFGRLLSCDEVLQLAKITAGDAGGCGVSSHTLADGHGPQRDQCQGDENGGKTDRCDPTHCAWGAVYYGESFCGL